MKEVSIDRDKLKDVSLGALSELIEKKVITINDLNPGFLIEIRRVAKLIGTGEPIPRGRN